MRNSRTALPLGMIILLTACANGEDDAGITSAEERQLDEAAAALDETQADYEAAIQTPDPEPAAQGDAEH